MITVIITSQLGNFVLCKNKIVAQLQSIYNTDKQLHIPENLLLDFLKQQPTFYIAKSGEYLIELFIAKKGIMAVFVLTQRDASVFVYIK